jgi:hypothetical protein
MYRVRKKEAPYSLFAFGLEFALHFLRFRDVLELLVEDEDQQID